MKRSSLWILIPLVLALLSCGQRKRDAVFYEQMVDSIRKAEQLQQMKRQAGLYDDPVENFFNSLQLRSLPIQSERSNFVKIGQFDKVPPSVVSMLGYPVGTSLKALLLPKVHEFRTMLLEEKLDSITSNLYLYTLDRECQPVDHLCLYEEHTDVRADDYVRQFMDYYITSEYEVTILYNYESQSTRKTETEYTRSWIITEDGRFEQVQ